MGHAVRYDANDLKQDNELLTLWLKQDKLVSFCPEVSGGMSIPRAAAEIVGGTGLEVLSGNAKVIDNKENDVTDYFISGAKLALEVCLKQNIKVAILTERSPSCGGQFIYNGQFNHTRISGEGVTAALLRQNNIKVFNQDQLTEVEQYVY